MRRQGQRRPSLAGPACGAPPVRRRRALDEEGREALLDQRLCVLERPWASGGVRRTPEARRLLRVTGRGRVPPERAQAFGPAAVVAEFRIDGEALAQTSMYQWEIVAQQARRASMQSAAAVYKRVAERARECEHLAERVGRSIEVSATEGGDAGVVRRVDDEE